MKSTKTLVNRTRNLVDMQSTRLELLTLEHLAERLEGAEAHQIALDVWLNVRGDRIGMNPENETD